MTCLLRKKRRTTDSKTRGSSPRAPGRGDPCTQYSEKMRDFVPVRTSWGIFSAAGDAVASSSVGIGRRGRGFKPQRKKTGEQRGVLAFLRLVRGARGSPLPKEA